MRDDSSEREITSSGIFRLELRSELGQLRVRQAGMPVMHAVIRLMEQSESH